MNIRNKETPDKRKRGRDNKSKTCKCFNQVMRFNWKTDSDFSSTQKTNWSRESEGEQN